MDRKVFAAAVTLITFSPMEVESIFTPIFEICDSLFTLQRFLSLSLSLSLFSLSLSVALSLLLSFSVTRWKIRISVIFQKVVQK